MADKQMKELHQTLVIANHILAHHKVVDAYGHVSARHPTKPDVYIMSKESPPALVESSDDLLEYWILDSQPIGPRRSTTAWHLGNPDAQGSQERFIHGEIYKRFPEVKSIVHSHDEVVMPYATSGVPLLPVMQVAGFLGVCT